MAAEYRYTLMKFLRDWMLVIAMILGAGIYLVYHALPALHPAGPVLLSICRIAQPVMLFMMLFLSFCRIEPNQIRPHRWQAWLLLIQGGGFVALSLLVVWALHNPATGLAQWVFRWRLFLESVMLCLICPTATACAVVTGKLGGNMAGVITYTVIINLLVAILVPLMVPLMYPSGDISFTEAFNKILVKVFPLLIMPCLTAWLVRYLFPGIHRRILSYTNWSFYIWAVSLTLAIVMSTRGIVKNGGTSASVASIALGSLVACAFQFWAGRMTGKRYGCKISAGQALGQKNTVFAIWMGYTFLNPLVSVAGGFYSIWHNCYNTWQLWQRRKDIEKGTPAAPLE